MLSCDPLYVRKVVLLLIKIRLKITLMTLQKKDCFFIVIPISCPKKPKFGTAVSVHNYEFLPIDPTKDEMKQVS